MTAAKVHQRLHIFLLPQQIEIKQVYEIINNNKNDAEKGKSKNREPNT